MGIKGQVLELRNEGSYQFYLKIGIFEEVEDSEEAIFSEEDGLPLDKPLDVYECRLDFSDAEKPVSYPEDRLRECLETYEQYETPEGLSYEIERRWKVGFIVDSILTEAFSSDFMEVVYGEDFGEEEEGEEPGEPWRREPPSGAVEKAAVPPPAPGRCPDCGAQAKPAASSPKDAKPTYLCEVCGRYFSI